MTMVHGIVYAPLIVATPVVFICACVYSVWLMGPSALVGMGVYTLAYILQLVLTAGITLCRARMMRGTDRRVQIISEMLTNIKFIKMYAWERSFEEKIKAIRRTELRHIACLGVMRGIQKNLNILLPIAAVVGTIVVKVGLGERLTASMVFTFLAVIYSMRYMLTMTQYGYLYLSGILVAIPRFKQFLCMPDVKPISTVTEDESNAIEMKDLSAAWSRSEIGEWKKEKDGQNKSFTHGEDNFDIALASDDDATNADINFKKFTLRDVSLTVKKGSLVGVCGVVGSGKTSLLHTILEDTHLLNGSLAVDGSLAYTSQQPSIFNTTIRDNITMFGNQDHGTESEFSRKKRYRETIRVCCLAEDIAALPSGDQTEIGERGINLSGGQKHRVGLARAVYGDRDVYLLDDPLSALDRRVALHIFHECFLKALGDKTVILVTSNLEYLSKCDEIIVVDNGRITEQGTHTELLENDSEYARLLKTFPDEREKTADDYIADPNLDRHKNGEFAEETIVTRPKSMNVSAFQIKDGQENDGKLVEAETREVGSVSLKTYLAYIRYAGGILRCALSLLLFVLAPASAAFSNVWLSRWINAGSSTFRNISNNQLDEKEHDISENPQFEYYRNIYLYSMSVVFIFCALNISYFTTITRRASSRMHQSLCRQIFCCPMSFFDTTPTGRIINRFARDVDEMDNEVPHAMETSLWTLLNLVSAIVVVTMVFPWFIITIAFIAVAFFYVSKTYLPGMRDIKRIENLKQSPVLSHIKAAIEAQNAIRAFGMEKAFLQRCHHLLDVSAVPKMLFTIVQRWLAFRLDLMVALAELVIGLFVVFTHGTAAAAYVGLALSYSVQFMGLLQFIVRIGTMTQARFTSVERINDYIDLLDSEGNRAKPSHAPPDDWPQQGEITFDSLELRYREQLPLVLKGISFRINAKEKVGIVGRTGSGKSSIAVALFRLAEANSGRIHIDGLDVCSVGLHELRSRMSIIPQDPVLFMGTLRYNLDPHSQYSDAKMWGALDQTYMKPKIARLEHQLEAPVWENGSNFSAGERQLLCLARALLRDTKILFLDEATAAVDTETDSLIQATIRTAFSECTVLTIAHRLHTVLDSDRIMVLDHGGILEMDTPAALLDNPNSRLSALLKSNQDDTSR